MKVRFDVFETEPRFDHVVIYDGLSVDKTRVLAKSPFPVECHLTFLFAWLCSLNGSMTDAEKEQRTFTSLGSGMLISFRTDADSGHKGFAIRYQAVQSRSLCRTPLPRAHAADAGCGCANVTLTNGRGSFHSPGFEEGFTCPGVTCNYTISVAADRRIRLHIPYARLVAYPDHIRVLQPQGGFEFTR